MASCDLPIQDPTVSRRHAELELTGAGVRVRDVGSTNGTYLDGVRIIDALAAPGSRVAFEEPADGRAEGQDRGRLPEGGREVVGQEDPERAVECRLAAHLELAE